MYFVSLSAVPVAAVGAKHTLFFEHSYQLTDFDPVKYFDTAPELMDPRHAANRPTVETLQTMTIRGDDEVRGVMRA